MVHKIKCIESDQARNRTKNAFESSEKFESNSMNTIYMFISFIYIAISHRFNHTKKRTFI
jgi:hypothetical protein